MLAIATALFVRPIPLPEYAPTVAMDFSVAEQCPEKVMALPVPLLAGTRNSPFMLAATLCDFGNGLEQLSLGKGMGTINSDVHLQLSRLPQGE